MNFSDDEAEAEGKRKRIQHNVWLNTCLLLFRYNNITYLLSAYLS